MLGENSSIPLTLPRDQGCSWSNSLEFMEKQPPRVRFNTVSTGMGQRDLEIECSRFKVVSGMLRLMTAQSTMKL